MQQSQDTGKKRKNLNDQFYTKESKAKLCVETLLDVLPECQSWLWIEPSAGKGAFLKAVPQGISKLGLDIEPKGQGIQEVDFLTWTAPNTRPILVFGNPPFGRQSSTAKAFIKHAATFADIIAFILPRSFKKPSMSRAFPARFHLEYTLELDPASFEVNDQDYSVPCQFQIWRRRTIDRVIEKPAAEVPFHFEFRKPTEGYHVVIRRVGVRAGKLSIPPGEFNPNCHYYIYLQDPSRIQELQQKFNSYVFPTNTTGPRSLSKTEITRVLNGVLRSFAPDDTNPVVEG